MVWRSIGAVSLWGLKAVGLLPLVLVIYFFATIVVLCVTVAIFYEPFDPTEDLHRGNEARTFLVERWPDLRDLGFAEGKNDFVYDGGNFNGVIFYAAFDVVDEDATWAAIRVIDPYIARAQFEPWRPPKYLVLMEGPAYYHDALADIPWDLPRIEQGYFYKHVRGDERRVTYYAIDTARHRVYYVRESGGFPRHRYEAEAAAEDE